MKKVGRIDNGLLSYKIVLLPGFWRFNVTSQIQDDKSIKTEVELDRTNEVKEQLPNTVVYGKKEILVTHLFLLIISAVLTVSIKCFVLPVTIGILLSDHFLEYAFTKTIYTIFNYSKKEYKQIKELHAAAHMGLNAYNDLRRAPSLDEIKKYSYYSDQCDYSSSINPGFIPNSIILISTVFLKLNSTFPIWFIILFILTILFYCAFLHFGWNKYIGIFFSAKPGDLELKAAIECLREIEEIETNTTEFLEAWDDKKYLE